MASVVDGELAACILHCWIRAAVYHVLAHLVPSRLGGGENCSLPLVIAALHIGDELGRVGMTVGDTGIDVGSGGQQEIDGVDRTGLYVSIRVASTCNGTTAAPATRPAHSRGGHQRRDLEDIGKNPYRAVRQQGID